MVGGVHRQPAAVGLGNAGHALFSHVINEPVTIRQRLIRTVDVGLAALTDRRTDTATYCQVELVGQGRYQRSAESELTAKNRPKSRSEFTLEARD